MPLAQLPEPWPAMELVHLDTEVTAGLASPAGLPGPPPRGAAGGGWGLG
uniref:Uncharacterized protein n=1 Tax=Falco tinnunculus TaxID=100819 RepID=A0A8C4TX48_FALTI